MTRQLSAIFLALFIVCESHAEEFQCILTNLKTGETSRSQKSIDNGVIVYNVGDARYDITLVSRPGNLLNVEIPQVSSDGDCKNANIVVKDMVDTFNSRIQTYRLKCAGQVKCLSEGVDRYNFKSNLDEETPYTSRAKKVLIATHSSSKWDDGITGQSIKFLNDQLKSFPGLKVAVGTDLEVASAFHVDLNQFPLKLHSVGGAHRMKFPNANSLYFLGGFLDQCLCESVRDGISGLDFSKGKKSVNLLRDGTFLFKDDEDWEVISGENFFTDANKEEALAWLNRYFLGKSEICPQQRTSKTAKIHRKDYSIRVHFENSDGAIEEIKVFGKGPKILDLNFITIKNFIQN